MSQLLSLSRPKSDQTYRANHNELAIRFNASDQLVVVDDQGTVLQTLSPNEECIYTPTISSQGTTATPSRIKIACTKPDGTAFSAANHQIRARVCDSGTRALSTNATIAVANATTELEDISTTDKDLVIQEAGTAALTTALSGSNNDLVYTAKQSGLGGNDISVRYVNPGTASATLSVSVASKAITVNLATGAGTAQVETAAVTSAAGPTESDTLQILVTSALFTAPEAVQCALLDADADAAAVATKIRAALTADTVINTHFTVGGTSANVVLTARVAAANDSTLNVEWYGVSGVTDLEASTNTTAGVAPAITSTATLVKAGIDASTAAAALVTVANASGNDGTGVVTALAATNLAGGATGDVFWLDLTDATAETVTLRLGPPTFGGGGFVGDYSASLNVTHVVP